MATFKVDDRVRIARDNVYGTGHQWLGAVGVVAGFGRYLGPRLGKPSWDCHVEIGHPEGPINCMFSELDPAASPGEEAWASDQVRKWTKPELVVPVVAKEKA